MTATHEVMESAPPQHAVEVQLTAPTGGCELTSSRVADEDGVTIVDLIYTTPGADEIVMQALTTLSCRVALESPPGSVRVRVSTRQRGAEYLVEPEFVPAVELR